MARAIDSDRPQLTEVLRAAIAHRGAGLVEIYQNCPIFNDGAWEGLGPPDGEGIIALRHGEPILTGGGVLGAVAAPGGELRLAPVAEIGLDAVLVHDIHATDPTRAFALSRLTDTGPMRRTPIGIFRQVTRPTFDDLSRSQIQAAIGNNGNAGDRAMAIQALLTGTDTWVVG